MLRKLMMAGMAVVATGAISGAEAQEGDLVRITSETIDLANPKISIDVSKTKGAYHGLRVRAKSGDIDVTCVQVVYGNGTVHNEGRVIHMLQGERSRPIDAGSARHIDLVNVVAKPGKGKATIEVLGYETSKSAAMARQPSKLPPADAKGCYGEIPASKAAVAATATKDKAQEVAATPTAPKATPAGVAGRALPSGDVLFGVQSVGFGVDRDVIRVGSEVGKFDRIRLRILENDIHLNEVKVTYSNGEPDVLAINADIKQNTKTNWLELKGDRFIKDIQLNYRSKPSTKGMARVEVFGQLAGGWLGAAGEGRKYNQGWVLLGAQTAGFASIDLKNLKDFGFETDVIPVGANEGGFKKVRVTVKDRAITLKEVRVIYESGAEDVIPLNNTRIDAGATFGPIDLKGAGPRAIKEVRTKYRSRVFDRSAKNKGAAIVEVWAQH